MYKIYENSMVLCEWDSLKTAKAMANHLYTLLYKEIDPKALTIKKTVRKKNSLALYVITVKCTGVKNGKLTFSKPTKQWFNV